MSEEEKIDTPPPVTPEEDFKDKYFRTLAEMHNMTKRMQKEKHEMIRFGIENAISEFLPLLDSFENALRYAEAASPEIKSWAIGFEMILSQFRDALQNNGITPFASEGALFDPSRHEAVEIVETEDPAEGTILAEFTKGYQSQHRIVRPARVKVAKAPAPAPAAEENLTK